MADLHYWRIVETSEDETIAPNMPPELTMLATGDVLADINTMKEKATEGAWKNPIIQLIKSSRYGEETMEDGKDKYRYHDLVMSVGVNNPDLLAEYP